MNNIGDTGENINFSIASRAMNIEPDKKQIKKFDEYAKQTTKFRNKLILVLLTILGLSIYLFVIGHWIWGSIVAVVGLLFMFFVVSINNTTVYKNGLIVPAIIIDINPIKIIALANMCSEENQKLIWGCQKITLKNLPNHKIEVGEKIPCVTMFGIAIDGYRRHFEPRPISWGYKNPKYITEVVDLITNDDECPNFNNEWGILENLTNTMKEFEKENEVVFFDENLNKVEMEK
ncbi:DUF3239 domain-containing protein [Candidatus Gracilibacteria bacterium]|nr:DUF3239 domain-containing protein [Candidatus Gracilibacteria bacterium]